MWGGDAPLLSTRTVLETETLALRCCPALTCPTPLPHLRQVTLVDGHASAVPPRAVSPWVPGVQYTAEHHSGWLYAIVDDAGGANRLLRTPAEVPAIPPMASWQVSGVTQAPGWFGPRNPAGLLGGFFVVPAWALPVPVSESAI